jgi:RimJ/RimL family protein N-acetyltransferase
VSTPITLPEPMLRDAIVGLRPWREADIPIVVAMSRDPDVLRFTNVPDHYSEDDAGIWLALQPARLRAGDGAAFAIVEPPDDRPLGSIGVRVLHGRAIAETGYHLAPEASGRRRLRSARSARVRARMSSRIMIAWAEASLARRSPARRRSP